MIRPIPSQFPGHLPSSRQYPDLQHFEDLSRLGDEITEMAAHLAAGTCELLELIHIFDEEEGLCFPGIAYSAHWLNWKCSMSMGTAREPLSVGRKTRSIPPAIRRALKRRDGGCCFPGCSCRRFVDAHHIHHWADGGETSMDNLVLLCRRHHRLVHEEGFGLNRGTDGAINFSLPDGKIIPPGPDTRFSGNVTALRIRNKEKGLNIAPDTLIPLWCGEKMDHQLAVLGLLQRE
jgi:hypothetical protein